MSVAQDDEHVPIQCFPASMDDTLAVETAKSCLAFALQSGNIARASDLADFILDHRHHA